MNNYSWHSLPFGGMASPLLVPMVNLVQSIQIPSKPNSDYSIVSKEFVDKFFDSNNFGITNIGYFYDEESRISLHIHSGTNHKLHDTTGHLNFKNKLAELGIHCIKYYDLMCTGQPIGKKDILITVHGKANINNSHHNIITTFVLHISSDKTIKIINHILEIYV